MNVSLIVFVLHFVALCSALRYRDESPEDTPAVAAANLGAAHDDAERLAPARDCYTKARDAFASCVRFRVVVARG